MVMNTTVLRKRGRLVGRRLPLSGGALACALCMFSAQIGEGQVPSVPEWTLGDVPEFSFTGNAAAPAVQLYRVDHGGFLGADRVVAANAGSLNLVLLDMSGRAVRVVGREGEGPGEFRYISSLFLAQEKLVVWDRGRARRASVFSADGRLEGTLTLEEPFVDVVGMLPGSQLVTTARVSGERPALPGARRRFGVWTMSGELVGDIIGPREPKGVYLRQALVNPSGRAYLNIISIDDGCVPSMSQVIVGSSIYVLESAAGTITRVDVSGGQQVVYRATSRRVITGQMQDDLGAMISRVTVPPPADTIESFFTQMGEVGAPLPAWERGLADQSGRVWLEHSRCMERSPSSFDVVDLSRGNGTLVARMTMPERTNLLSALENKALVVRLGPLGVEHLELYAIVLKEGP